MMEDSDKLERTLIKGFREEEIEALLSYLKRLKENISVIQERN